MIKEGKERFLVLKALSYYLTNHGQTMGKPWANHGKPWETMGVRYPLDGQARSLQFPH